MIIKDFADGAIGAHNRLNVAMALAACSTFVAVSYTQLRAHETVLDLVCRLLLEKKKYTTTTKTTNTTTHQYIRTVITTTLHNRVRTHYTLHLRTI